MKPMPFPRTLQWFRTFLEQQGPAVALSYLNDGVPHRYTAVYRLHDNKLEVLYLHDKQGAVLSTLQRSILFEISFFQFALRYGLVATHDCATGTRLDGCPYQDVGISDHSVPIVDDAGELLGNLCHFDVVRQRLPEREFALLQHAARAFPIAFMQSDRRTGKQANRRETR